MNLRHHVNRALRTTTGYQIVRAGSGNGQLPKTGPEQKKPAHKKPAQKKPARSREQTKAPASKNDPHHPQDYDEDTRATLELIDGRTMNHHTKTQSLIEAVRYVVRHEIPGGILECGVWRGGSMLAVANTLLQLGVKDRDLYLFDTFTGMTEPTERDVRINEGKHASELLEPSEPGAPMQWSRPENFVATVEDVREGLALVDYPSERVHLVEGKVEETVPDRAPETLAILRLDTDWYESTRHELRHLYQRLSPGGVLIIDDYGTWQGAKEATDEFLAETGQPLLLTRVHRSRIAIKPGLHA